jgi:hypothetical protein
MSRIVVPGELDAQYVFSALEDYAAKLDRDLRTRYDGDPRFGIEDATFLGNAMGQVRLLLHDLNSAHPRIVMKG